jgi:hypothetical protein
VLRKRVLRVGAQSALGVVRVLLRALGDIAALVVDVVAGLACLRIRLPLGLGGLAAGVGGRHDEVCVWSSSVACEVVGEGWEVGEAYGWVELGLTVGFEVGQLLCDCVQRVCTVPLGSSSQR